MCELFGYSGTDSVDLAADLKVFFSHAAVNPDGWGLVQFRKEEDIFQKEERRADRSQKAQDLLTHPIGGNAVIGHIRLATIGYDEYANTHPFSGQDASGRTWTFAHNGTIFEGDVLSKYLYMQEGNTDSERILLYLLDRVNEQILLLGRNLTEEERFLVVEELCQELSEHNKLNFLLYDGEILYVHENYRDTLYYREAEEGIRFATKPLDAGKWEEHPFGTLISYRDGVRRKVSEKRSFEYIPDEKSINALYLAYSGL